jgi:hypothetical protein
VDAEGNWYVGESEDGDHCGEEEQQACSRAVSKVGSQAPSDAERAILDDLS